MSGFWKDFVSFLKGHKDWMLLPVLIILLLLTMLMIFNRTIIHMPFVYSSF
ncbi:DUF5989 family protein [Candidatus Omnitrophota bacterium]